MANSHYKLRTPPVDSQQESRPASPTPGRNWIWPRTRELEEDCGLEEREDPDHTLTAA